MSTDQPKTICKEMGLTHKDFYNELPELLADIPYEQVKDTITFQLKGKKVEIVLGPEGVRELGFSVRIPVTFVNLRFYAFHDTEINEFIRHFNLKFMKGGG